MKYYARWALGISLLSFLIPVDIWAQAKTPSMILGEPRPEDMVYTYLHEAQAKALEVYHIQLDYQSDLVPEEVDWARFRNLRSLSLRHCALSSLPPSIGELSRLEVLDLGANPDLDWWAMLEVLEKLPRLRHLVLDSCAQRDLPEKIGQLKSLTILNIHGNRLYELPSDLWQLPQLQKLDASSNLIQNLRLPEAIQAPLSEIELSVNLLEALPWPLLECPTLEKLYLDYTNIREIKGWLPERSSPVRVYLRGNEVKGDVPQGDALIWVLE